MKGGVNHERTGQIIPPARIAGVVSGAGHREDLAGGGRAGAPVSLGCAQTANLGLGGGYAERAACVLGANHCTNQATAGHGATDLGPLERRQQEEAALEQAAKQDGAWLDHEEFTRKWEAQGNLGGREHQVYFDPQSHRFYKRTDASKLYLSWQDYLVALRVFSDLFPDTAYRLEGFSKGPNRDQQVRLHAVVSQPAVGIADRAVRRATHAELTAYMQQNGFVECEGKPGTWKDTESGVVISDLHSGNVFALADAKGNPILGSDGQPILRAIDAIVRRHRLR